MGERNEEGPAFGRHGDPTVSWGLLAQAPLIPLPCPRRPCAGSTHRGPLPSTRWDRLAQCRRPLGLALEAAPRRLCPRGPLGPHHLYANAGCDPGGASGEHSQLSDMLLRRGPQVWCVTQGAAGLAAEGPGAGGACRPQCVWRMSTGQEVCPAWNHPASLPPPSCLPGAHLSSPTTLFTLFTDRSHCALPRGPLAGTGSGGSLCLREQLEAGTWRGC